MPEAALQEGMFWQWQVEQMDISVQLPCWSRAHYAQRPTYLATFASYWSSYWSMYTL